MEKEVFEDKEYINKAEKMDYRYGIMGGTFDPIHIGHLFLAEMVLDELRLDKVLFIPTGISPHKDSRKISTTTHRLTMATLAAGNNPNFQVLPIEVNRQGKSYTVDTLSELRQQYSQSNQHVDLYFITGADGLLQFETWRNYDEILKLSKLVVVTRAGYDHRELDRKIESLTHRYQCDIQKVAMPALEISSTDIRRRVAGEKTIRYLVPQEVETYIYENQLYR